MPNLYNPDYLLHLCKKYGLAPSKRYGQNYLIDESVIAAILAAADLKSDDTVIEVGPGFGVLTLALAERAGRVVSFEIEKKLEPYWSDKIKNEKISNLEIVWGNVLREFELKSHPALPSVEERGENPSFAKEGSAPRSGEISLSSGQYKVVANLPYQITSPVIRLFLEAEQPPELMVLMVQKEVAERICAKPGRMSLLSVAVQYYADAEVVVCVPHASFWPTPRVDSAVIKITNKKQRTINKEWDKRFFTLVKAGFANRRKLLLKNLLPVVGKEHKTFLTKVFVDLGFNVTIRAQELSIEQWVELVQRVQKLDK